MRPVEIKLKNFGPYADTVVDFTEFDQRPLFLVAGNTGAGKTTIFDAMCYALFGQTTNEQRSAAALRSDFAPADQETSVTFTFVHQGQKYRVTRRPKQTLIGRRGRPVEHNQAVELVYPLESDQPHEITKIKEADAFITDLLNLTRDQFRQIVLLPQGKFRQFLDSDSNTKEELLRDLFNTTVYERWTTELKARLAKRKQTLADQATKLQTAKENVSTVDAQLGTDDWLAAITSQLTDLDAALAKLAKQRSAQQAAVNQASKQLHTDQELTKLQAELTTANQTAAKLAKERASVAEQQSQFADLQWFQAHRAAYQQWADGAQRVTDQEKRLTQLKGQAATLDEQYQAAVRHYQALASRQGEMAQVRDRASELQKRLPLFAEFSRLTDQVKSSEHQLATAQAHQAAHQKQVADLAEQVAKLTAQLASRGDLAAQRHQIDQDQHHQEDLDRAGQTVNDLISKQAAAGKRQADLMTKLKKQTAVVAQQAQALADLNDADARYQIARLATRLKPGSPCPVCGATDHPHPAQVANGAPVVTDDQLQAASDRLQGSRDTLSRLQEQVKQVQQEQADLTAQLVTAQAELAGLLGTTQLPDDWQSQLDHHRQRVQAAAHQWREAQAAATAEQDQLAALQEEQAALQAPLEKDTAAVQAAQATLTRQQAILETKRADLPAGIADEVAAKRRLTALQDQFQQFTDQLTAADQERQGLAQRLAVTKNALMTTRDEHAALLDKQTARHERLLAALHDYREGLAWDFWEYCQAALPKLARLQAAIQDYQTRVHDNQQHLQRLTTQIAGRPVPDLAASQDRLNQSQAALSRLQQLAGQRTAEHDQLQAARQRVTKLVQSSGRQEEELAAFQTLTDVVTGNAENHLSLERYVLQAYFEDVLTAANVQLDRLTNGRYQFELANESHGAGAKWSGLEVNVYDDNAGKTRSARTLSGGESFMASLALALALCQIIQEQSGGIAIDALFVDEGFGSLDQDALADALRALQDLEGGRMIGIISHVTELEEQIPDQLRVTSVNGRSQVSYQHDLHA
ncbi:SMC family ATPase [Limosilactobacillus pontis]|uniref:SMC family ATPase n=1 Tax=Limosilactobacillus pontis TaxID=35787 RepID=UPI002F2687E7